MNILFYRYGSICEPAMLRAFRQLGITVHEECAEITDKSLTPAQIVNLVEKHLKEEKPAFVFSINFYPVIARLCHIYKIFYLCWTVDSPVMELFSNAIKYNTNKIFLFDYAQYEYFQKYNPENIFYLPLASDIEQYGEAIAKISEADRKQFACDISFVGSLYNEKNPLAKVQGLSDYAKGCIDGISEASLLLYGYYPAQDALPDKLISEIKEKDAQFLKMPDCVADCATDCVSDRVAGNVADYDRYLVAQTYLGHHIASLERIRTLNALAQHFSVDLFTRSDVSKLAGVHTHGGVQTLTEMPKIFHLSKINLNMTIKPIQTGLPLRIFDILGCGGFLMTNYQSEIPEYFEPGVDLETYSSQEELIEKCAYYLSHEDERAKIAANGYEKVRSLHTYQKRLEAMLQAVLGAEG